MATPTAIVAYLALFTGVGFLFLFANLLLGRFLRPDAPNQEKQEIYECGEPTIGSSFVQFDLRFYVVALLFLIFDVEVAMFFPWATVFGKVTHLADPATHNMALYDDAAERDAVVGGLYRELGASDVQPASFADSEGIMAQAQQFAWWTLADIGAFFAVLLVGFAYVWRRGDLDWVRAVSGQRGAEVERGPPRGLPSEEPVLSA